ncbi:MAG: hypothetical protein ACK56F_24860, partial [bacterium]
GGVPARKSCCVATSSSRETQGCSASGKPECREPLMSSILETGSRPDPDLAHPQIQWLCR